MTAPAFVASQERLLAALETVHDATNRSEVIGSSSSGSRTASSA